MSKLLWKHEDEVEGIPFGPTWLVEEEGDTPGAFQMDAEAHSNRNRHVQR